MKQAAMDQRSGGVGMIQVNVRQEDGVEILDGKPASAKLFAKVASVEEGPGSRIARWPSDSSSTAAMERGLPVQWRSIAVAFIATE